MKYQFVKFTNHMRNRGTNVTLLKSGFLRLSAEFCRMINIEKYQYVFLFCDKEKKVIALSFTNNQEEESMKITRDRSGAFIATKSFFTANGFKIQDYLGKYEIEYKTYQGLEMYIFNLTSDSIT